ncbi:MAG: hypothetical protein WGN25_01075 [Candidatus Electrothrix sp. GW3-4]|uniref:hypothetical protein n=1 Tax=Candidatus Electrothrix sp. GW3-4 TaxID=3126740 RepID=UPI0030D29E16
MNHWPRQLFFSVTLSVMLLCFSSAQAVENRVVVVPLLGGNSSAAATEKEVYIPAHMFRPVLSMTAWSFEEEGAIINPNDASYWIAPILLPVGATIISLELVFKNAVANSGTSSVMLHLLNQANAQGLDFISQNSFVTTAGVQTVKREDINWVISEAYHASVRVYLGNTNRWLLGVKVVYSD